MSYRIIFERLLRPFRRERTDEESLSRTRLKKSLRFKVTAGVGGVLLLIYTALLIAETHLVTKELSAKAQGSSEMLSLTVERSLRNAMSKRRRDDVSAIISSVAELPDIHQIAIVGGDGKILLGSADRQVASRQAQVQAMVKDAARTGRAISRGIADDTLVTVHPIRNEARCWSCHGSEQAYLGYMLLDLSTRTDRLALSRNRRIIIASGVAGLALTALTLLFMLSNLVYKPVDRLMAAMLRIKEGDVSARADTSAGDELSRLSETMNSMVSSLEQQSAELAKTQEHLLEARRLATVGLLVAGMAHEINNPMAAISVATEGLTAYVPSAGPGRKLLDTIGRSAERISDLVSDLLRFDPDQPMSSEPVDINQLVKETVEAVAIGLSTSEHEVGFDLAADTEGLVGDRERLRRAIANIVTNGFEAMPAGGSLIVRTESTQAETHVMISDTGSGITAEDLPSVTDPFFTRKEPGKGRGLGLAIAREMIAQHAGNLSLSSVIGEGTTVCIRIPKQNE